MPPGLAKHTAGGAATATPSGGEAALQAELRRERELRQVRRRDAQLRRSDRLACSRQELERDMAKLQSERMQHVEKLVKDKMQQVSLLAAGARGRGGALAARRRNVIVGGARRAQRNEATGGARGRTRSAVGRCAAPNIVCVCALIQTTTHKGNKAHEDDDESDDEDDEDDEQDGADSGADERGDDDAGSMSSVHRDDIARNGDDGAAFVARFSLSCVDDVRRSASAQRRRRDTQRRRWPR